ncbi:hypothetical protein EDF35_1914 [Rathayibacter sp. PhB151]|uniref:hypothetical protein n=1 Tax=Rathayibacter sp. PhB151 TaxID=2485189 RepID=UPI0010630290|nr:hypothetical protein [Rathayibacter sp. PhB151]TDX78700.1 hypothetical protein EDF35_1914 [Rathayibacter sp. PhB151]
MIRLTLVLLAVAALTINWQHGPARLARKLSRRSPKARSSAPTLTTSSTSIVADVRTLAALTGTGPLVLAFSPYQPRGSVKHVPAIGFGLPALVVHPDHRAEISRAHEYGQLPERLRVY